MKHFIVAVGLLLGSCAVFLSPEQMEARRQLQRRVDAVLIVNSQQTSNCTALGTIAVSDSNPSIAVHKAQEEVVERDGDTLVVINTITSGRDINIVGTVYRCGAEVHQPTLRTKNL